MVFFRDAAFLDVLADWAECLPLLACLPPAPEDFFFAMMRSGNQPQSTLWKGSGFLHQLVLQLQEVAIDELLGSLDVVSRLDDALK